ncbi:MAG: endonuclease/exonuclease/phosphatase family protein [Acidimicrobiia bacterium]
MSGPRESRPTLRVATWNLRHGRPRRGFTSNRMMAQALGALDVDVLAVQEVERRVVRSWFADQPVLVSRATGMGQCTYAPARRLALTGSDGVALAVRGSIVGHDVHRFAGEDGRQDRVAVLAEVDVGERRLSVAATHLQNDAGEALRQLADLVDRFASWPLPRVVLGDLNLWPDAVEEVLGPAGYTLAGGGPTEPAWAPAQRIDHVAVAGLLLGGAETPAVPVSDHRPVVVSLS